MRSLTLAIAVAACAAGIVRAQPVASGFVAVDPPGDRISARERDEMWAAVDRAEATLALPKQAGHPLFRWPTRPTHGYWWPRWSRVSNFVDHDAAHPDHLRDYNCGTRTYDTATGDHKGTDIASYPDGWNMMAARQVEIVAAAPGTIIDKIDGNFDQNCAFNSLTANRVTIQHDDGSIAFYLHMKSGTPTSKPVGTRVQTGEYLGSVGSSGNSTGPHLHFEVYDAARNLIDPFSGACNPSATESWWASQPPYRSMTISALYTASASPVPTACANGVLQTPFNRSEKLAFAPGDPIYFVAHIEDQPAGTNVAFRITRPDGTLWKSYFAPGPTSAVLAGYWWYTPGTLEANAMPGTWIVEAQLDSQRLGASFNVTAAGGQVTDYTDLWWNPAESGWGINLNHQGDALFATWFTYDTDGKGMWLVMSDARRQPAGDYTGTLYRTTGVAFDRIAAAPASLSVTAVGTGSLRFGDRDHGTFAYTVNGVSQQKSIQRQAFSTAATCMPAATSRAAATNYQDLWWNPAESGWGVNLAHQGETIFATWFTYDARQRGQWLVASAAERRPTGEFRGQLYRTSGTPFMSIAGAAASSVEDVGEVAFAFADGENGAMTYTLDGTTQSKAITRQRFASTAPLCR